MLLLDLEKVNATVGPGEAVMNTLIGMGTVFVVLILISIIFLEICAKDVREKESGTGSNKTGETGSKSCSKTGVPVSDNTQIIAVITAAIAAQMEAETGVCVPADGLVIRSIKKRTFN